MVSNHFVSYLYCDSLQVLRQLLVLSLVRVDFEAPLSLQRAIRDCIETPNVCNTQPFPRRIVNSLHFRALFPSNPSLATYSRDCATLVM